MRAASVLRRVAVHARQRGVLPVAAACGRWGAGYLAGRPTAGRTGSATSEHATFEHDGRRLPYLRHPYHYTWLNERAVEVPLAAAVLAGHDPERVLEIGNVLGHYLPVRHQVVDKFERAPGVLNVDVVDLALPPAYDIVLAVSTLEHVGYDESGYDARTGELDPAKTRKAVDRLVSLLAPGGRLWCTLPVGYNSDLDEQLRSGDLGFTRLTALRRTGRRNRWAQVPLEQVWDAPYDGLLYTASGVVIAERSAPSA